MNWHCADFDFDTKMPIVMGILNVTPDSFSDGGSFDTVQAAFDHAKDMVDQGASIIDVGGESTRPGAEEVSPEVELERVLPVVKLLAEAGMCVSVDTRHALVAQTCVAAGASIINDVSGFRDEEMRRVAAGCDAGLVVMHMQGDPQTMQDDPSYTDVVSEVKEYLRGQAALLEDCGVDHDRICIDPGPGFGKTHKQSLELMRNLHEFVHLGYPVMAAPSRKSYVAYAYRLEESQDRDTASAAEALLAAELGASVLRMHNVAMTMAGLKDLRPYVILGLGCNSAPNVAAGFERQGKIALLNHAISDLLQLPDTEVIDIAGFYESEPAYYLDQDVFVNTVVLLRSGIAPKELLDYLHNIENALGRVREIENGPRTCDLDILDYQMYVCQSDVLTLPHPRICERDFVVKPLLEILPGHVLSDGTPVDSVAEGQRVGKAFRL